MRYLYAHVYVIFCIVGKYTIYGDKPLDDTNMVNQNLTSQNQLANSLFLLLSYNNVLLPIHPFNNKTTKYVINISFIISCLQNDMIFPK